MLTAAATPSWFAIMRPTASRAAWARWASNGPSWRIILAGTPVRPKLHGGSRRSSTRHVGDNQPYPIDNAFDYTIPVHGESRGLLNIMIEIRQDGIGTTAGAAACATRLAEAYRRIEAEALGF